MKFSYFIAFTTCLIFFITSFCRASSTQVVSDTEVIVGAHTSESGAMAAYSSYARSLVAYIDRINEKGGIHGRKLKFVKIDTQGENSKTAEATRKLVDDVGIFAMVSGMGMSHQAGYKYLLEKGVPDLYFQDGLLE